MKRLIVILALALLPLFVSHSAALAASGQRWYTFPGTCCGYYSVQGEFAWSNGAGGTVAYVSPAVDGYCVWNNAPDGVIQSCTAGDYFVQSTCGSYGCTQMVFWANFTVFGHGQTYYCYSRYNAYSTGAASGYWGTGTSTYCKEALA